MTEKDMTIKVLTKLGMKIEHCGDNNIEARGQCTCLDIYFDDQGNFIDMVDLIS